MKIYCKKCKQKQEAVDPVAGVNIKGRKTVKGICSVCGGKVFSYGVLEVEVVIEPRSTTPTERQHGLPIVPKPLTEVEVRERPLTPTERQHGVFS